MKRIRMFPLFIVLAIAALAFAGMARARTAERAIAAESGADISAALPVAQEATPEPLGERSVPETAEAVATPGGDLSRDVQIELEMVADGLNDPINVVSANDGSGRLFVVERPGVVRVIEDGEMLDEPFLDISGNVLSAFLEQGLYDIEFHPDYAENGRFFIHYAELLRNGDSMIVEYQVSADDANVADPESAQPILQIEQPYANHNGGELAFGPDGYLYIGSGDGGWEGDPLEAGESINTLLGKILRIDVNNGTPYAIPEDNPFAGNLQQVELFGISEETFAEIHTEAKPEIWAYGLRNPWKFSFDPANGDLFIAEVGQNVYEEIDYWPADGEVGVNYGWDYLMGTHCFPASREECDMVGTLPIAEYEHELGSAVIGIGVYRGDEFPALDGIYFAGDYGSGRIWGLAPDEDNQWQMQELLDTDLRITSGGADEDGTIYVTSCQCEYGQQEMQPGALWRLVAIDEETSASAGDGEPATATPASEAMLMPSVTVEDQQLSAEDSITVPEVTSAEAGWIVIHADEDGAPGPVVGHAAVEAGENMDVAVAIDADAATATLYAMLHADAGEEGVYEFPGADAPVEDDEGDIVVQPFELTGLAETEAEGDMAETNAVEVGLVEYDIRMPDELPAGPTEFTVANNGTRIHNFAIEGEGISQVFDTNLAPGETRTMQVDLAPGTYEIWCPVPGHRALGMELELTVTGSNG